eukprot:TRINITY_DN7559_c0_g1_i1.p1 TRINITY_DN7559_c0_g1~~TRINITY_DN7559_c0_g1_i1.p1  ORF type:complete len:165 (+),score=52.14 TRINITY_DN7559_c0_g1_i1:55-549(+)
MRIFFDIFTDEEIGSDAYPRTEVEGIVYKVETKMVTVGEEDFGIENNEEGADPAAGGGVPAEKVNNLIHAHKLQVTSYDKASYMKHIKAYLQKLKKKIQENGGDVKAFEEGCKKYVGDLVKNFSECNFYVGEEMKDGGMVIIERWEGETPFLYFFKDGVREEKV